MTYLQSGDRARSLTDHYPAWLDDLADNVTPVHHLSHIPSRPRRIAWMNPAQQVAEANRGCSASKEVARGGERQ